MFARADQLRIDEVEGSFRLHVVDFYWEDFEPHLVAYDVEDGELKRLDLGSLNISVSKKKKCVGYFSDDGDYVRCPTERPVGRFSQCPECGESLIPRQECIFEPQCEGDMCDSPLCRKDHAVYIAFFGNKPKVGMTVKSRIRSRLIEQGADAYFMADTQPNRKSAREREKSISGKFGITERPSSKSVLESLKLPMKRIQIEDGYNWMSKEFENRLGAKTGPLEFLDSYPLEEPLTDIPKCVESYGVHSGEPIGVKGKYLVYRSGERLSALKLSDLPSRYISLDKL